MTVASLGAKDREQLEALGIPAAEAERQLELLAGGARPVRLVRPCCSSDGIVAIAPTEVAELHELHRVAAEEGRLRKFTPASGAATRMFRELFFFQQGEGREMSWSRVLERARQGHADARVLAAFVESLDGFAFRPDLERELAERGENLAGLARIGAFQPILDALLAPQGLGYGQLPKGLLAFHRHDGEVRTPFEEHLVEAVAYARGADGLCRLHFTVSPEHRQRFEALFRRVGSIHGRRHATRFEIEFSAQQPSTDTLATDLSGRPLRDAAGRLVLRPGGHGALIDNLDALQADLVYVKNIDNVQPDRLRGPTVEWKRTLGGFLLRLQQRIFHYLGLLAQVDPPEALLDEALRFVADELCVEMGRFPVPGPYQAKRAFLIDRLNRPVRVCGVVPNTGEPGGGPFWVRDPDGTIRPQIVETAQVDGDSPEQQAILRRATHFNPVDLVCGVRDVSGAPFRLQRFVDPSTALVARKSVEGTDVLALERPGLWNGAMAGWITVFVEVPLATFTPVKSVLDLLRDEHRAG